MTEDYRMTRNDSDLLAMIRNQDRRVFELLYQKYWHPMLKYAAQFLEDEDSCEEIVQDLFVHLYGRHAFPEIRSSVSSYLYAALRNRIRNFMRRQTVYKKHILLSVRKRPGYQNNVEQFMDLVELQRRVTTSLKQMPVKYREVYVLHKQHHLTLKKIAWILKRPVDTVEKQLRKATTLLRVHLTGAGI